MEEGTTPDSVSIKVLKKETPSQQRAGEGYPHPEWMEFGEIMKELQNHGHMPYCGHSKLL